MNLLLSKAELFVSDSYSNANNFLMTRFSDIINTSDEPWDTFDFHFLLIRDNTRREASNYINPIDITIRYQTMNPCQCRVDYRTSYVPRVAFENHSYVPEMKAFKDSAVLSWPRQSVCKLARSQTTRLPKFSVCGSQHLVNKPARQSRSSRKQTEVSLA